MLFGFFCPKTNSSVWFLLIQKKGGRYISQYTVSEKKKPYKV